MVRGIVIQLEAFAILLAATTLLPSAASAGEDIKAYPGTTCQQAGTSQGLYYYHGRAINTSTAARTADCPVVTDSPLHVYKGQAAVYVVDRNYSRDFSCSVLVYDQFSPRVSYRWSNRRSAGSGEHVQILSFDFRKSPIPGPSFAPTLIGCSIPGTYYGNRSDLVSYRVNEYEYGDLNSSK